MWVLHGYGLFWMECGLALKHIHIMCDMYKGVYKTKWTWGKTRGQRTIKYNTYNKKQNVLPCKQCTTLLFYNELYTYYLTLFSFSTKHIFQYIFDLNRYFSMSNLKDYEVCIYICRVYNTVILAVHYIVLIHTVFTCLNTMITHNIIYIKHIIHVKHHIQKI